MRTRWAAVGAAVAVTLGAGGIGLVSATEPADAVTFVPITPCRVLDTRPGADNVGPKSSPLGPAETHSVAAHGDNGNCTGIPTTATALSLNVTALGATEPTFLTMWATGAARPDASSLNPVPGAPPTPNGVTTGLGASGEFSIYNLQGSVDVIADINGYFTDHTHDDRYYTKDQTPDILPFSAGDSTTGNILLTDELQTILSVPIQAKVAGQVIVNSSTNVFHDVGGADVVCFILPAGEDPAAFGTNIPGIQWFESGGGAAGDSNDATISGTRSFDVAADTATVFELRCAENGGDGGRVFLAELNAIFIPTASDL